jgi:hypothetical protein
MTALLGVLFGTPRSDETPADRKCRDLESQMAVAMVAADPEKTIERLPWWKRPIAHYEWSQVALKAIPMMAVGILERDKLVAALTNRVKQLKTENLAIGYGMGLPALDSLRRQGVRVDEQCLEQLERGLEEPTVWRRRAQEATEQTTRLGNRVRELEALLENRTAERDEARGKMATANRALIAWADNARLALGRPATVPVEPADLVAIGRHLRSIADRAIDGLCNLAETARNSSSLQKGHGLRDELKTLTSVSSYGGRTPAPAVSAEKVIAEEF